MLPTEPTPPSSYPFRLIGGLNHVYAFTTIDEIGYEIRFVPSAYMFEDYLEPYIDAYEMIIAVADNPLGKRLPADARTEPTVRAIFYDFFTLYERVVIFICDSADGRHEARARKFTSWYYYEMRPHFFKFDARWPDGDRSILLSIILHDHNTHFADVVNMIQMLGQGIK